MAVDASGNAIASWEQISGGDILIEAAYLPSGGAWAAPETLSSTGTLSFSPDVDFDSSGKAFVVWNSDTDDGMVVQTATLPSGGSWSAITQISESGSDSISPHVSVAGIGGSALVCWTNYTQAVIKATAWIPSPVVESVSPNFGSVLGGETVTITGRGFFNVTSVYFGSTLSSFDVTSFFEISATAPKGAVGTVDIVVTTLTGTSPITVNDQYTYHLTAPAPTITAIYLNHGPITGGNYIKIVGTNFVDVTQVNFDSTPATSFSLVSPTHIIATVPPGSAGMVDVTVTTGGGTSMINAFDQYTYH